MKQSNHETIKEIVGTGAEVARKVTSYGARLLLYAECLGLCAVPFIMIQHQARDQFWYCLGAYGIYLVGVAHVLRRWL